MSITSWRTLTSTGALILLLTASARSPSAQAPEKKKTAAEPGCSAASLRGAYAFSLVGANLVRGVQYALVGQFTADGVGALTGKGTQSIDGSIARKPFKGKYEVAADCTGTATISFQEGGSSLDFFIADGGADIRLITTGQGTLESGSAVPVAARRSR